MLLEYRIKLLSYKAILWFKNLKFVRILAKPWIEKKLKECYRQYLCDSESKKIITVKNICQGKRCFIIGNGPSLTVEDLERLKGEYTFAANRIYEIFSLTDWRPWTYLAMDKKFVLTNCEKIRQIPCQWKVISYEAGVDTTDWGHTIRVHGGYLNFPIDRGKANYSYIQEDLTKGFSDGYTVTFVAIQLAIYMGFTEIYLLGIDFNYSVYLDVKGRVKTQNVQDYFHGKKLNNISIQALEPTRYAYQVSRQYCDKHGIIIRNATRGGKLEEFERVDFETVMGREKNISKRESKM